MTRNDTRRWMPAFGIAAMLMTGLVMTLAVYVPARLAPLPAGVAAAKGFVEVTFIPSRIEVIGTREARTAATVAPATNRAPDS